MTTRTLATCLLLLTAGCVTTRTTTTTWDEPGRAAPARQGQVAWIREIIVQEQGDPVGGAALGAVVGGLLGHAVVGHSGGALVGAIGGAAVGASASQGSAEDRRYEVAVRFEHGEQRVFVFRDGCPFAVGDAVSWTSAGLQRTGGPPPADAPPPPPPSGAPPPPSYAPPPPPPF